MNKFLAVFVMVAISSVLAGPISKDTAARRALPAVYHEEVHDDFGQYMLRYATAEGTMVEERGRLIPNPDGPGHVLVTEGSVTYIGDDGKTYVKKYSAGLEGVKVEANHLPIAPKPVEVPAAQ